MGAGMGPAMGEGMALRAQALENANFEALTTYLGLSADQVTKLKDAMKARAEANRPVLEQIREKQQQIAEEMKKDNPNPSVVGQLMVEVKKLRDSIRDKVDDPNPAALAILTDAQKAKLKELEAVQKLVPAVHQAEITGLLARPEQPAGVHAAAGRAGLARAAQAMGRARVNRLAR